jgi:hypothetical protein
MQLFLFFNHFYLTNCHARIYIIYRSEKENRIMSTQENPEKPGNPEQSPENPEKPGKRLTSPYNTQLPVKRSRDQLLKVCTSDQGEPGSQPLDNEAYELFCIAYSENGGNAMNAYKAIHPNLDDHSSACGGYRLKQYQQVTDRIKYLRRAKLGRMERELYESCDISAEFLANYAKSLVEKANSGEVPAKIGIEASKLLAGYTGQFNRNTIHVDITAKPVSREEEDITGLTDDELEQYYSLKSKIQKS